MVRIIYSLDERDAVLLTNTLNFDPANSCQEMIGKIMNSKPLPRRTT